MDREREDVEMIIRAICYDINGRVHNVDSVALQAEISGKVWQVLRRLFC